MRAQTSPPVIRIQGVSKFFGAFQALKEVSLDVHAGDTSFNA